MYNRYSNNKILKTTNKVQYLSTTLESEIVAENNDYYIISQQGDRLDLLAFQFYNDVTKWTLIARANHIGKGTLEIEPGLQLRIPMNDSQIQTNDIIINT